MTNSRHTECYMFPRSKKYLDLINMVLTKANMGNVCAPFKRVFKTLQYW
jgi:hypothetical protein